MSFDTSLIKMNMNQENNVDYSIFSFLRVMVISPYELVNINLGLPLYRGEPIMKMKHHYK